MLLLGGLVALFLLDPAVTAWAGKPQATHLAQHVAPLACGVLLALAARPAPHRAPAARRTDEPSTAPSPWSLSKVTGQREGT
ncbi:MAG: hypothetical protein M0Z66_12355 [Thermaerobacter sp.]|nr:hypothetical protein [Thermaerobacter sp.]